MPIEARDDLKPGERERLALRDNLNRRHMNAAQKRAVVEYLLTLDPGKSNRTIAGETGTSHVTVGKEWSRLESSGKIDQIEKARVRRGSSAYEMKTGGKKASGKVKTSINMDEPHDWSKQNLVSNRDGSDTYKCRKCGQVGKRGSLAPVLSVSGPRELIENCREPETRPMPDPDPMPEAAFLFGLTFRA